MNKINNVTFITASVAFLIAVLYFNYFGLKIKSLGTHSQGM